MSTDNILPPGRPRSFDKGAALQAIVDIFWEKGYSGTSYADLEAATGLRRQSLIYAFGDKQAMFKQAVDHYAAQRVGLIVATLSRPGSPLANIQAAFEVWAEDAAHPSGRACLLVNTAGEVGPYIAAVAQALNQATDRLIAAFEATIEMAQKCDEIDKRLDAKALAALAVAAGDGALLHARSSGNARRAQQSFKALHMLFQ